MKSRTPSQTPPPSPHRLHARLTRLAVLACTALLLAGFRPLAATAQDAASSGQGASGTVNPFYGSFSTEVPIAVPEFHGIEPKLQLVYNSGGGNSFVGVGWSLSGQSTIVRAGKDGGVPAYDATDSYYLDGQKLIPNCTSQGGTHCTEIQNYTRIIFKDKDYGNTNTDYANDTWEVWGTNGSRLIYKPLYRTANDSTDHTYTWFLTSASDANGNEIHYNHTTIKDANGLTQAVYLDSISYNYNASLQKDMIKITFCRETRPDTYLASNGVYLANFDQRLKSIVVQVYDNSVNIKAYALVRAYTINRATTGNTGKATGRSLVTSVTQWGNNALLSSSGDVTNPAVATSLPAMTFGYQTGHTATAGFTPTSTITASNATTAGSVLAGDVNGDGRADIVAANAFGAVNVYLSDSSGVQTQASSYPGDTGEVDTSLGDVNDDGRVDLIQRYADKGIHVALGQKDGQFTDAQSFSSLGGSGKGYFATGDVNGDGRLDLVTWDASKAYIYLANPAYPTTSTKPFLETPKTPSVGAGKNLLKLVNLDGNTRTDIAIQGLYSGQVSTYRYQNDGTLAFLATTSVPGGPAYGATFIDVSGDGVADLVSYNADGLVKVALGLGDGSFMTDQTAVKETTVGNEISFVDINGDGLTDIVRYQASGDVTFYLSKGDGSFAAPTQPVNGPGGQDQGFITFGDLDGDGRPDMVKSDDTGTISPFLSKGDGTPDMLNLIQNGIGGSTAIDYTPSSAWTNTFLPAGMVVQTASQLTTSTPATANSPVASAPVNYQYEGGLWSTKERRFFGFRKVSAVISEQGDYTETYYFQQIGSISKPEITYFKDNQGQLYRYSKFEYTPESDGTWNIAPYSSLMTARWEYECNLTTACRRSLAEFSYDQYGNVIATYEYGDYDQQGDERTTVRSYYPNTTKYILGLPTYENIYQGLGTEGRMIEQRLFYYDNATLLMTQPVKGNLTKVQKWNDQTGGYSEVKMQYDAHGNLTNKWDEMNRESRVTYDTTHHLFPEQECKIGAGSQSLCATTNWGNYVMGMKAWEEDANNARTEYSFDAIGRPVSVVAPDDPNNPKSVARRQTIYQHYSAKESGTACTVASGVNCVRKTLPGGLWEEEYVDGLGRKYLSINSGGIRQQTIYDSTASRVTQQSLPYDHSAGETPVWVVTTYDGSGRVRRVYNPDATPSDLSGQSFGETIYGMDSEGQPFVVTYDEVGNEKVTWRDVYGNLTQIREKNGDEYYYTTYEYDVKARLCRARDHLGNISTFTWDSLGRKITTTTPELGTWSYTYYDDGALRSQTDNKGNTVGMAYDPFGRVQTKSVAGATDTVYLYDEAGHGASRGRLTGTTHPAGSDSVTYDLLGRETATSRCVEGICKTIAQSYDDLGRLDTVTYPVEEGGGQDRVRYGYDSLGRLHDQTLERSDGGAAQPLVREMLWSADGRLKHLGYGNNTTTDFDYDPNRRWLSQATVKDGANATLYQAGYEYGQNGLVARMTSSTDVLMNVAYSYDGVKRLTRVSGESGAQQGQEYRYDAIGNRLYANEDPVLSGAVTTGFQYDQNGNLEQEKDPMGSVLRTFSWDAENRLSQVTKGATTATYRYDPNGGRLKKSVTTVAGGVPSTSTTLYFGPLVEETNGVMSKYYYAGGILVAKREAKSGAPFYYHADRLGSTKLMTDAAGSAATGNRYNFAAFGRTLSKSGTVANERGFTGQREDAEVGLIYMGARYYDPMTGRFISPDTVVPDPANPQSLNRYAYALNNPVSYVDPSGHEPVSVAVACFSAYMVSSAAIAAELYSVAVVAWMGAGMTALGSFTNSPELSVIGSVMLGFSGGPLGGIVALATSPISPLDPGVKQAIGWAYMAYGVVKMVSSKAVGPSARATENPCDITVGRTNSSNATSWEDEIHIYKTKKAVAKILNEPLEAVLGVDVVANSAWANSVNSLTVGGIDATTLYNQILLPNGTSIMDFFNNGKLVLEEYFHVLKQWAKEGPLIFAAKYEIENCFKGYDKISYEIDAKNFADSHYNDLLILTR